MTITDITPVQKKKDDKMRLAAYCRVSSDSTEQMHSFATQIRYYNNYSKEHPEYELVDIYADEGLTGTEMQMREDFNRLLRDCKKGKIDRIIVKSVSRFARNTEELLITIRILKDLGVSVYFEEQGIDTNKLNAEMIITFPGMVAQQESMAISGNLRWGIHKRMQNGSYKSPKAPFGYKLVKGGLVVDEDEAKVVRKIFELYLQGNGMCIIADILNQEGVSKPRADKPWGRKTIQYILRNEKYVGDALFQKKYTTETLPFRQKLNHGERPRYYVENYTTAIVDRETYNKVQALLEERKAKGGSDIVYPLGGKMRCPDCGKLFRRLMMQGNVYWCCSKLVSNGGECKRRRVREEMVYDAFTMLSYKLKMHKELIIEKTIRWLETAKSKEQENNVEVRVIDQEIKDLGAKNVFIARLQTSGVLSMSDSVAQIAENNNRISELRKERKKRLEEESNNLDELYELSTRLEEYNPNGSFDEELFRAIVEKIIVNDNAEITFCLYGGLQLKEKIKKKGRCKRREE